MRKIIYKNIIIFVLLVVLPWYISEQEYRWNILPFDANYLLYPILLGSIYLVYMDIRSAIKSKGGKRIVSIIFIIPPLLVILYFVLGFIAVSRFKIL